MLNEMSCTEVMAILEVCLTYHSLEWLQRSCLFYVRVCARDGGLQFWSIK